MKKTIDIKADIGDRINIPDLELKRAVVLAVYLAKDGTTYEVAYFHNGDRKTTYLHPHEFETVERNGQL